MAPTMTRAAPVTILPPEATAIDCIEAAATSGAMNANDDPKYLGTRPCVITKKIKVPTPEKNSAAVGGKPVRAGTNTVEPNMAITCCKPIPMVWGHAMRSVGLTTCPALIVFPSPCRAHPRPQRLRKVAAMLAPFHPLFVCSKTLPTDAACAGKSRYHLC